MAGFPTDKNEIDNRSGQAVVDLRRNFETIQLIKDFLDNQANEDLMALGYTVGDVDTLRAAFTDLSNLGKIAHAEGTQPAANDFFFNARKLTGLQ